jgi:hypothetical protein
VGVIGFSIFGGNGEWRGNLNDNGACIPGDGGNRVVYDIEVLSIMKLCLLPSASMHNLIL